MYPKITNEDMIALAELQAFAGEKALFWTIEGGDADSYCFEMSLKGYATLNGIKEDFYIKRAVSIAYGANELLKQAKRFYGYLPEEEENNKAQLFQNDPTYFFDTTLT